MSAFFLWLPDFLAVGCAGVCVRWSFNPFWFPSCKMGIIALRQRGS